MIQVLVQRDRQHRPVAVEIRGHALFAEYGQDIVCAAVSMLVQTVVFALDELLALKPVLRVQEGYLLLARPKKLGQDRDKEKKYYLLLETMLLGMRKAAGAYAANLCYREKGISRLRIAEHRNTDRNTGRRR